MSNYITYEDKVATRAAGVAKNQGQDVDFNEIKNNHNLNDDRITVLEDAGITSDLTVTVGTGGDYATINEALEYLSKKYTPYKLSGITAEIMINTGYFASEQICVKGLDLAWITISSEDAEVLVDSAAMVTVNSEWLPFISGDRANLPMINTIFTSDGVANSSNSSYCGIYGDGGDINIEIDCGFKGFGSNLRAEHACSVNAKSCVLSDGYVGAWIVSSMADLKASDLTNNTYAGILAYDAAFVRAFQTDCTGSGTGTSTGTGGASYGFAVQRGAIISRSGGSGYLSQAGTTPTSQGIIF